MLLYQNPQAPVDQRVEDLLSRMTLEEKVGQMNQCVGVEHFRKNIGAISEEDLKTNTANAIYPGMVPEDLERLTEQGLIGSFLHVLTIEEANHLQRLAMKSRLGIPVIFGIDAIHGNANAPDNTVYPTNLGLAGAFDPELAYRIARQTAAEMRAMNMHWTFNPNIEIARDPRWGRCGETFGEDPYLVGLLGTELVKGYQGNLDSTSDVLACIKHFTGGSQAVNGTNGAPFDASERTIRELFFPPYILGVNAGAGSLMTSHNEINGVPCHQSEWLMNDVLRGEWGFKGFVVSDWDDIEHLHDLHRTATSDKEAFYNSIMAGMDMHMHGPEWNDAVVELVREGRIPESRIDESVRRILEAKFRLGLFEHPYADEATTMQVRLSPEHRATALEAARKSIVLLKNDGLLPLDRNKYRNILVTGINADDENILGDWSASQKRENVSTVLDGIKALAPDAKITFVDQGWDPRNMNPASVDKAAKAANKADLNIVVAGEYMMRHRWTERTCGEDTDRSDIDLVGLQNELIRRVAESGKPTLLVLINGRPLGVEWAAENLPAIVEAWEPGMYGGQAIAEILFGEVNPSAKLAITIPRSVGQTQMVYNHKPSTYFHPVVVTKAGPLWPFGFGLSYTKFDYSDLRADASEMLPDGSVNVSIDVTNSGDREGTETVQLYIRDDYASFTRPVKELKDFAKVTLAPGQTKTVTFKITPDKLTMLDRDFQPVVEPGTFTVMAGSSSDDRDLKSVQINVRSAADGLRDRLAQTIKDGKVLFGHHDDPAYGHNWKYEEGRSDVRDAVGEYPAIMNWDFGGIEKGDSANLDGVPFEFMRAQAIAQNARGGINSFSWHPYSPVARESSWETSDTTIVSKMMNDPEVRKRFDGDLQRIADFFNSLRDEKGNKIPVIFRPWHEHTGNWFWWGEANCTKEQYKFLWEETRRVFDRAGVDNVLWTYSPDRVADIDKYLERYPGDRYVDIMGADIYNFDGKKGIPTYRERVDNTLSAVIEAARKHGKIPAFSETGCESLVVPDWYTSVLLPVLKKYPVAYVTVWRNAHDKPNHYYVPFAGHPAMDDFKKFYNNPSTVFVK